MTSQLFDLSSITPRSTGADLKQLVFEQSGIPVEIQRIVVVGGREPLANDVALVDQSRFPKQFIFFQAPYTVFTTLF